MRTPHPFEPNWRVSYLHHNEEGSGLLTASAKLARAQIVRFMVRLGNKVVTAIPATGEVLIDGGLFRRLAPGPLEWFRRMEFSMSTADKNATGQPTCLFYGLGFGGEFVRLFEDGTVKSE